MSCYIQIEVSSYNAKYAALRAAGGVPVLDSGRLMQTEDFYVFVCLTEGLYSKVEVLQSLLEALEAVDREQIAGAIQSSAWAIPKSSVFGEPPYFTLRVVSGT